MPMAVEKSTAIGFLRLLLVREYTSVCRTNTEIELHRRSGEFLRSLLLGPAGDTLAGSGRCRPHVERSSFVR
jgi:hypothetical protein